MGQHNVYRFTAKLEDTNFKIWRTFEINGEKTMAQLAYAVMIMFETRAQHLFELNLDTSDYLVKKLSDKYDADKLVQIFKIDSFLPTEYLYQLAEVPEIMSDEKLDDEFDNRQKIDPTLKTINQAPLAVGVNLDLIYDLSDDWNIKLTLEQVEKRTVSLRELPHVIAGEGFGIIENCGGPFLLEDFYHALHNENDPGHIPAIELLENQAISLFDFDINETDYRVKKLLPAYRRIYQQQGYFSNRDYRILARAY